MRFVFLSYHFSQDIHSPEEWLNRLTFYIGSMEILSKAHEVIRVDQINYTGNFEHNGVKYYCIDDGKKKNYLPKKLHQFVKSLSPDIIVVSSFLFPIQIIQLRKQVGNKVKIIVQNHADKPFTGIKKYLQVFADKRIDAYAFASHAMGVDWVEKGNINHVRKIHEIPEGSSVFYTDDKLNAREETNVSGNPVFLWVGRLNENKNPVTVVEAFLDLVDEQPDAKLYMVYQTTELLEQVKALQQNHKNGKAIVLIGTVEHASLQNWYNSADIYVSGSYYEGSGIAVMEAMSCGCIPVLTDIFSFRSITKNGDCGVLYEAGNKISLITALQKAIKINTEEQRKKIVAHFNSELSFTATAQKFQLLATSL